MFDVIEVFSLEKCPVLQSWHSFNRYRQLDGAVDHLNSDLRYTIIPASAMIKHTKTHFYFQLMLVDYGMCGVFECDRLPFRALLCIFCFCIDKFQNIIEIHYNICIHNECFVNSVCVRARGRHFNISRSLETQ